MDNNKETINKKLITEEDKRDIKEYIMEYAKKLLEKMKNAPEIPINAIEIYDAILIEPLDEDSWDSGYRTLNFYGYLKVLDSFDKFIIEKIGSRDCLNIHTLFKKLKGFEISIDIPFYTNVICIYCKNHDIQVENREFKFIKK